MTTGEATAALQSERRASEGAEVNSGRRYALPDVDSLDISQYNEVKLNGSEMARLQSEAMTWDAKHRNTLRTRTLSNGIHYRYYIDNDGIVHCLDREPSQNIHEDRRNYDDRGTEQLDRLAESLRAGQRNDGGNRRSLPDGRESADNDRLDHRKVRSEGESDRGGHPKNGPRTDRNKKAVRYKFDEDGSGHGVTYYSDGTTERFALPDTASAAETAGGETDTSAPKTDTTAPKTESTVREIEAWAKENVKRYGELLPNEKREIRAMVRQARALGIPEADIRRYANLEARTHVRVSFSKDRCFAGTQEDGTRVYADGFYDPDTNEIVVNPEGKRSAARLILHELSHFLYKGKYGKVIDKAVRRMDEARATEVAGRYAKYGIEVASEEVAVHHAEDILGNERNLDRLLRDEPTIGDKILSFFGLARYGDDVRLSRAAGKLLRHFERAMNTASAHNVGGLTLETTSDAEGRRYAYSKEEYDNYGWARANDVLTAGENAHYRSQFAAADKLGDKYRVTPHGELMIPVSDEYDAVWKGVERKIVFAKGTIDNPIITRVLEIDLYDVNEISEKRSEIYALERAGLRQKTCGVFTIYTPADVADYADYKRKSGENVGNHDQLRTNRRGGSREAARATAFKQNAQNAHFPIKDEFVDISGVNRVVLGYGDGVYGVYGTRVLKDFYSVEEAIYAENKNIINGYARRYDKTPTWVIDQLRTDPDFLKKARRRDKKFALPDGVAATATAVGRAPVSYEAGRLEKVFAAKDRLYMETVDEMYGAVKYLRKAGGMAKAEAEAAIQAARSAQNQSQAMIGSVQYNVFSEKPEKMGDGLLEIYKLYLIQKEKKRAYAICIRPL